MGSKKNEGTVNTQASRKSDFDPCEPIFLELDFISGVKKTFFFNEEAFIRVQTFVVKKVKKRLPHTGRLASIKKEQKPKFD